MDIISVGAVKGKKELLKVAQTLAIITIGYNIFEGLISVAFGYEDETLALFGFGLDSFVEVISGVGILHMVRRMGKSDDMNQDMFEARALRITGGAFYLLGVGLTITSILSIYSSAVPETTFWGIVVAVVSIFTMWALIHYKVKVGKQLRSDAILADANCTKACLYLSIVLLVSSVGYELTGMGWFDAVGAVFIAWFAIREGRESFEKAGGKSCCDKCTS